LAGDGDCASFPRSVFGSTHLLKEPRELPQSLVQAQGRITRNQYHTNLRLVDGRDVHLALRSPMQFHELAPGRDPVMTAKGEALFLAQVRIQTCPAAYTRPAAVGAD